MTLIYSKKLFIGFLFLLLSGLTNPILSQETEEMENIDKKVEKFLKAHRANWYDMNVPESDGKVLYNIIIKNNYQKALEIGTSTGHSGIWMAWALSKTGGKLITIEIDRDRHNTALANFKEAGLSKYIDARLADAHDLVEELQGPFDFVFSDADKDWYTRYFIALAPKLRVGGCFTAHNVSWSYDRNIRAFLNYVKSLPNFETTINRASSEGISISYKRAEK
jgi:predicted O-methyltransferase YrrM